MIDNPLKDKMPEVSAREVLLGIIESSFAPLVTSKMPYNNPLICKFDKPIFEKYLCNMFVRKLNKFRLFKSSERR